MNQNNNRKLTAYPVIVAATQGDIEAIHTILNSYAGYIAVLAMREVYDEYGNIHLCIDEELRPAGNIRPFLFPAGLSCCRPIKVYQPAADEFLSADNSP